MQSFSGCVSAREDVDLGQGCVGSKGNLMERPKDRIIRTGRAAASAAGRRPRLAAAACAVLVAAPLERCELSVAG
jgi:hypothetical protein